MGRPTFLGTEVKKLLKAAISKRAIEGDAVLSSSFPSLVDEFKRTEATLKNQNSLALQATASTSTLLRLRRTLEFEAAPAQQLNATRLRGLTEMQNALSAACVGEACKNVKPSLYTSFDEVTIQFGDVFSEGERKVITPVGFKKEVHSRGRQVSTSKQKTVAYRTIPLWCAHTADGEILHVTIVIKDRALKELKLRRVHDWLLIAFVPAETKETELFKTVLLKHIFPLLEEKRKTMDAVIKAAQQTVASSSPLPPALFMPAPLRIVISLDGATSHIETVLDQDVLAAAERIGVEIIKWAAACSMTQAPADLGEMHPALHRLVKSIEVGMSTCSFVMDTFLQFEFEQRFAPELTRTHVATYRLLLANIEGCLKGAFTASKIFRAWQISGLVPFKVENILSGFAFFSQLPEADASLIVNR